MSSTDTIEELGGEEGGGGGRGRREGEEGGGGGRSEHTFQWERSRGTKRGGVDSR